MSDTATISDAKAWCLEARKYLGLSRQAKKDVRTRARDVANELKKLQKAVNSKKKNAKSPIDQKQYEAYETQFSSIGKALHKAVGKRDNEREIGRLSDLLDGLKLELAVKLAKKDEKKTRAQEDLSDRQDANIEAANKLLKGLADHPEAKAIKSTVDKIEAMLADAIALRKDGKSDKARTILTAIGKACAAAMAKADEIVVKQQATYEKDLKVMSVWFSHFKKNYSDTAQAIIKDKIKDAKGKIESAKSSADAGSYSKANSLVKEAYAIFQEADVIAVARRDFEAPYGEMKGWLQYLEALPSDEKSLIVDEVKTVKNKLKDAEKLAGKLKFDEADTALDDVREAGLAAQRKLDPIQELRKKLLACKTDTVDFFNGKDDPTKEVIKKELETINDNYRQAEAAGRAGNVREGNVFLAKLDAASAAAKDLITARDLYGRWNTAIQGRLDGLLAHPSVTDTEVARSVSKVTTLFEESKKLAENNKFADAKNKCVQAQGLAIAAKKLAQKLSGDEAIARAESALSEIKQHKHKKIIKGEMNGIIARLDKAKKAAKKGDYLSLDHDSRLPKEITLFVARSKKFLAAHDAFLLDLKAKEDLFAALTKLDTKSILTKDSGRIQVKLDLAEVKAKGLDHDWANSLLKDVEADCTAAKAFLESHLSGAAAHKKASKLIAKVSADPDAAIEAVQALLDDCKKGTPPKAVTDRVRAIQTAIANAAKAAKRGKDGAQGLLEQARKDCAEIGLIAERHLRYLAKVAVLTPVIQGLEDHDGHEAIANRLVDIKKKLASADVAAQEGEHGDAMDQLGEIVGICVEAKTKADLALKLKPDDLDETALTELALKPGGDRLLDELIESLGEEPSRRVLKAAMKARFGIDLELPGKEAHMDEGSKSVKKLYELLRDVPKSHTKGNPKLQKIERYDTEKTSGSYRSSTGQIKLMCGRQGDTREEELCATRHLPDVEDDCKPKGGAPSKFSFCALHEIGHAVDDKIGFMARKGGDEDKGAWKSYGSDVAEVAVAGQAKTKYNKDAIKHYLENKAWPNIAPAKPNDSWADDDWIAAKAKAEHWCAAIRNDLWWKGSLCKTVEVGGRVYQEAYDNDWVSYLLSARTKGITGYQFRAPGEWFAELYAAHHSGSLQSSHPAMGWLQEVSPPKPGS